MTIQPANPAQKLIELAIVIALIGTGHGCAQTQRIEPVTVPGYSLQLTQVGMTTVFDAEGDNTTHTLSILTHVTDLINHAGNLRTECVDLRLRLQEITDEGGRSLLEYWSGKDRRLFPGVYTQLFRQSRVAEPIKRPRFAASFELRGMPYLPTRLRTVRGYVELFLASDISDFTLDPEPTGRMEPLVPGLEFAVDRLVNEPKASELVYRYRCRMVDEDGRLDSPRLYAISFLDEQQAVMHRKRVPTRGSFLSPSGWFSSSRQTVHLPKDRQLTKIRLTIVTCRDTFRIPFEWENVELLGPR